MFATWNEFKTALLVYEYTGGKSKNAMIKPPQMKNNETSDNREW